MLHLLVANLKHTILSRLMHQFQVRSKEPSCADRLWLRLYKWVTGQTPHLFTAQGVGLKSRLYLSIWRLLSTRLSLSLQGDTVGLRSVWVTFIWMFIHFIQLSCQFCLISTCPSRIWQPVEERKQSQANQVSNLLWQQTLKIT